jgi:hypothetical protein
MLGQHGAGSSALQAVAACLAIRRGAIPPTINHEHPDPACGELRVVTRPEIMGVNRVLMHAIGLGGFYYSAAAFEQPPGSRRQTGLMQVKWSEEHNPKFAPAEEYQKPLTPWAPRQDP